MSWFAWAVFAAINFTIYSLVIRTFLRDHGDAKIFAALSDLTLAMFLLSIAIFVDPMFDVRWTHIGLALVASVLYASSSLLLIWGRQLEEVSRISIARQTTTIVLFTGGVLVLDEPFSLPKLLGVALIVAGTIVAFVERGHLQLSKGMGVAVAGSIIAAASSLIGKTIVDDNISPALYVGLVSLLASLWLTIGLPNSIPRMVSEIRTQSYRLLIVSAFLGLSIYSVFRAYQDGEASRVGPVYGTAIIMSVLAGIVFLNERSRIGQKIAGAILAFSGVIALRLL